MSLTSLTRVESLLSELARQASLITFSVVRQGIVRLERASQSALERSSSFDRHDLHDVVVDSVVSILDVKNTQRYASSR
jgi:hypothetical protein